MKPTQFAFGALFVVFAAVSSAAKAQPVLTVLHDFSAASGSHPIGSLFLDTSNAFYGSTEDGGTGGKGTIFKLTPDAGGNFTKTVLYSFTGGADGARPNGGIIFDSFGAILGTAALGGNGSGVVFKLTPPALSGDPWTQSVVYAFSGGKDGKRPSAKLLYDSFGGLHGLTEKGGAHGGGVLFKLIQKSERRWIQSVVFDFGGANGGAPRSNLQFDTLGALYVSTSAEGRCCGTVLRLLPDEKTDGLTANVLAALTRADGVAPEGTLVFDTTGSLYGVTSRGGRYNGGTVFKLTPEADPGGTWTLSILHHFGRANDGATPVGGLLIDNRRTLYGATRGGGSNAAGTIFKLAPPADVDGDWLESVVYSFTGGADGAKPAGELATDGSGALFGLTSTGGANNAGTFFRLMP